MSNVDCVSHAPRSSKFCRSDETLRPTFGSFHLPVREAVRDHNAHLLLHRRRIFEDRLDHALSIDRMFEIEDERRRRRLDRGNLGDTAAGITRYTRILEDVTAGVRPDLGLLPGIKDHLS